ncbi:serine hydrolase domain-containing protein [Streptomyces altiplanensis]
MNARTRTLLATALVLGIAAGPAASASASTDSPVASAPSYDAPDAKALRAAITGLRDRRATAALVRVSGTDGTWRGSAGVHDLRTGRAADPDARFRAGSVTKVFTAAVVLQLASERKVDLDRSVRAYLPEHIPAAYEKVTVRQLLNHTSGLPSPVFEGTTVEEWYANRFHVHTPTGMVASAVSRKELFPAGTQQHYSNIGYTIAGLLVEKLTGRSYEDEVTRRIIKPLALHSTSFPGTDPRIHGPHNHGYQTMRLADGSTGLRDVSVWSPTDGWAAGDVISTSADLERFTHALFGGQVVRGPLLEEMFTLPRLTEGEATYSAGLTSWKLGGRQVWGKTGGRWGYNAGIGGTRDRSRILVYSVNSTDAKGQDRNPVVTDLVQAAFGAVDKS